MNDRFNTIAGWTLFSGIVALGLTSASARIFHADNPEAPEEPGYFIEGAEEEEGEAGGPPLALLLNTGSAEAGEAAFAKCLACHTIEQGGANGIGPNLYGVLGKPIGQHAAGFAYSSALADHGGTWDFENMSAWLAAPRAFASGTKMAFAGLANPEERANVILYLLQNGGGPPLPPPPAAEAPAEGEGEAAAEGADPAAAEAAGATAAEEPVPAENAATN